MNAATAAVRLPRAKALKAKTRPMIPPKPMMGPMKNHVPHSRAGTASGIDMKPHAAKKPARPATKSGARFTGTLGEGGDVTVKLAAQSFNKFLRETRELESASATLEIKRDYLKKKFARENRP